MLVIPHTMTFCLTYSSMQAPGLLVPGLGASEEQGLFTFSPGLTKQASHTFTQQRRVLEERVSSPLNLHKLLNTSKHISSFFFCSLSVHAGTYYIVSLMYFRLRGRFHLRKTFFLCQTFVSITVGEVPILRLPVSCVKCRQSERHWTGRYLFSELMEISDRCVCVCACVCTNSSYHLHCGYHSTNLK